MLTDELRAAGWKPHDGGPCPVDHNGAIEVYLGNGLRGFVSRLNRQWEWADPVGNSIIAYKEEPHAI